MCIATVIMCEECNETLIILRRNIDEALSPKITCNCEGKMSVINSMQVDDIGDLNNIKIWEDKKDGDNKEDDS